MSLVDVLTLPVWEVIIITMFDRSIDRDPANPLLEISGLTVSYGGAVVIADISFEVERNTICGLIGPNGAGKTTLFDTISGLVRPTDGSISLDGMPLVGLPSHRVAEIGISRTFQNVLLLPDLTVRENVVFGAAAQRSFGMGRALLGLGRLKERQDLAEADSLLEALGLASVADAHPDSLPFGTLKRIELARAVMARPTLLMLDEPANGLSADEVSELATTLERLKDQYSLTILLVEHHMGLVQRLAQHAVVLDSGRLIAEGSPQWVCEQPQVIEAYLGTAA